MALPTADHRARVRVLGCPVDVIDPQSSVRRLVELVDAPGAAALVVTLNPEMVMRARRDPGFRAAVEAAALVVPDGIGIVRAVRRRGFPGAVRVAGIDLLTRYLDEAVRRGHRLAFAGGRPGVAEAARRRLVQRHPGLQVVAVDAGKPDALLAARLRAAAPHMVWAAFGAGKQELFLLRYLEDTGARVGVGVGGVLDYLSGRLRRAPAAVQRAGLEWAWRLAAQPWRARRQIALPRFWYLERREAATAGRAGAAPELRSSG
jgi:N-acetylglucosaminyldiphosphoundecaprenol N-acetyl-beta-D-mannosaminyltransferase